MSTPFALGVIPCPVPDDGLPYLIRTGRAAALEHVTERERILLWMAGEQVVQVDVGQVDNSRSFYVPKDLLTKGSEFFALALQSCWSEGRTMHVRLPDADVDTFHVYVNWLYQDRLATFDPDENDTSAEHDLLIRAYCLGDKLRDADFCDAAIDGIIEASEPDYEEDREEHCYPYLNIYINRVWALTPAGSPLRRFFHDMFRFCGGSSWLDDPLNEAVELDKDFLLEMTKRYFSNPGHEDRLQHHGKCHLICCGECDCDLDVPWHEDRCVYHEHKVAKKSCYRQGERLRSIWRQQSEHLQALEEVEEDSEASDSEMSDDWMTHCEVWSGPSGHQLRIEDMFEI